MDSKTKSKYNICVKIIKAIAHPTRLFIIDELTQKELCVCELTEMIGDDISTVSKHLTVLKNAGIVTSEKRGAQVYYRLYCPCILKFLGCIESVAITQAQESLKFIKQ